MESIERLLKRRGELATQIAGIDLAISILQEDAVQVSERRKSLKVMCVEAMEASEKSGKNGVTAHDIPAKRSSVCSALSRLAADGVAEYYLGSYRLVKKRRE